MCISLDISSMLVFTEPASSLVLDCSKKQSNDVVTLTDEPTTNAESEIYRYAKSKMSRILFLLCDFISIVFTENSLIIVSGGEPTLFLLENSKLNKCNLIHTFIISLKYSLIIILLR